MKDSEKLKHNQDAIACQLLHVRNRNAELEHLVKEMLEAVNMMKEKYLSALELQNSYMKMIDNYRQLCKDNEGITSTQVTNAASSLRPQVRTFPFADIDEATHKFDEALVIYRGSNCTIYKGLLHCTEVAIKILPHTRQGSSEFKHQVDVLRDICHPNVIAPLGVCTEGMTLVYEYFSNGSLEERLNPKSESIPLSWKSRILIAVELCSALIYLHSNKTSFAHGNLNPSNIFLDRNFVCKVGDFGVRSFLESDLPRTDSKFSLEYMDPDCTFIESFKAESDVYSFGIIVLRLLTGLPAVNIAKKVQEAVNANNLKEVLDFSAGEWSFKHAEKLALLGLRCSAKEQMNRPDLKSEVWPILKPMKSFCGGPPYYRSGTSELAILPTCFICPLSQEFMLDPHIVVDGYTYEGREVKQWFSMANRNSPVTNVILPHAYLIPHHSLRAAIQEMAAAINQMPLPEERQANYQ